MTNRTDSEMFDRIDNQLHYEQAICQLYSSGNHTTEYIAKLYGITSRSVQRIAKKHGVLRTQAESNKLMARHKRYHQVPKHLKPKRKQLLTRARLALIAAHPYCTLCGSRPEDGIRLEVDHIDDDATNNVPGNLQVLCQRCNLGKSQLRRFGLPDDRPWSNNITNAECRSD